jgi:hypothetical protein
MAQKLFLAVGALLVLGLNTVTYADSMSLNSSELQRFNAPSATYRDVELRNLTTVKTARLTPKDNQMLALGTGGFSRSNSSSSSSSSTKSSNGNPQHTPEPLSMILLGTGLAGGAAMIRRSRSR